MFPQYFKSREDSAINANLAVHTAEGSDVIKYPKPCKGIAAPTLEKARELRAASHTCPAHGHESFKHFPLCTASLLCFSPFENKFFFKAFNLVIKLIIPEPKHQPLAYYRLRMIETGKYHLSSSLVLSCLQAKPLTQRCLISLGFVDWVSSGLLGKG